MNPLPQDPASAMPLIEHLATWGEVSEYETCTFRGCTEWLDVLRGAGLIGEVHSKEGEVIAWALTRKGEPLLDVHLDDATKLALFQVPAYRAYLMGILAEGLVLVARAGMHEQLEAWTGADLAPLVPEINTALDHVEDSSSRLIDASRNEIERRCAAMPGRNTDFSSWDQPLLGRAGRAQDLFEFVLRKFAPFAVPPPSLGGDDPATVLRRLPLASDDGLELDQGLRPDGWSIGRRRVKSSIFIFDEHGRYLDGPDGLLGCPLRATLQDALVEQPFYKAVVHLAICAWRSPVTTMPAVELRVSSNTDLCDLRIVVGSHDGGLLRERLPRLVGLQGVRVFGLPEQGLPSDLMHNVLRNLLEHEVLRQVEGQVQLHPDYQASLMAERLNTVFRPGKQLQCRMVDALSAGHYPQCQGGLHHDAK